MNELMKYDADLSAKHMLHLLASAPTPESALCSLVGSMFIHREGHDYDYVLCCPFTALDEVCEHLRDAGYDQTSQEGYEEAEFTCFRRGEVNVMVSGDKDFYGEFTAAAKVCRLVQDSLMMSGEKMTKAHRIKIHRIIMNGEEP